MSESQGQKRNSMATLAPRRSGSWRPGSWRWVVLPGLGLAAGLSVNAGAWAQPTATAPGAPASVPTIAQPPKPAVENSYLDGPLLYQLLLAEFARNAGQTSDAIELEIDAARNAKDDQLFRRALEMAVEAGAGDKALAITKTWRQSMPKSTEAVRTEVQLLFALDRVAETSEPLRQLLSMSTPAERAALIAGMPRVAQRAQDKSAAADQFQKILQPYMDAPETRTAAHVALGRMRLADGQLESALELASTAQAAEPASLPPVLLALDVMTAAADGAANKTPRPRSAGKAASSASAAATAAKPDQAERVLASAEAVVRRYLAQPGAEPLVRQAFAGVLAGQERLTDAAEQLRIVTQARPDQPRLWLGLGEVELELRHPQEAEAALTKALALVDQAEAAQAESIAKAAAAAASAAAAAPSNAASAAADADDAEADDTHAHAVAPTENTGTPIRRAHIQLQLARAAEQRKDDDAAARWLSQIGPEDSDLQVIALRATLLARKGQLDPARALIHDAPAASPAEERYRLLTEVQLLLDANRLDAARDLLAQANAQSPDDIDLIYQEAMVDERLERLDDMERLLRRILTLQPDNSQALNALGYSLADRNVRLEEALGLVKQAHELSPADPFIVDSLGWVMFRMGQFSEATNLLNQAYASRKDTEIAAHLGEALWADGKRDEATQVLRDALQRDATNEVLRRTMARLKVAP